MLDRRQRGLQPAAEGSRGFCLFGKALKVGGAIGVAAVGVGTVVSGLSDGISIFERMRQLFNPAPIVATEPVAGGQAAPVDPIPQIPAEDPIVAPEQFEETRLAEDITGMLSRRLLSTCTSAVEVANIAPRHQTAEETSHGLPSTFLQATVILTLNGVEQRFPVAGSGRGPAAKDDAYRTLLENAVAEVRKLAPACFR